MTTPRKVLVVEDYCDLLDLLHKGLALPGWDDFISRPFAFSELETHLTDLLPVGKQKTIEATVP